MDQRIQESLCYDSGMGDNEGMVAISASVKIIPRLDTCIVYAESTLIYSSNSVKQLRRL